MTAEAPPLNSIGALQEAPTWNKWELLGVVMTGTFMAILDSSIVNIALPHIMTTMGVNVEQAKWVTTAFMLASAVVMPLTGWIGQRIGYGRLYLGALALFTVGSVICGTAWNIDSLIVARVIQAFGAGFIQPTGMAMITQVFEPHERGRAIGIWGIGAMVAPTIGPTTGAYLTEYFSWRSIFTVNIPVGVILLIMGISVFGRGEKTHRPPAFDWPGFIALAIFLICLLLGLDSGQDHGWDDTLVVSYFVMSGIALLFLITIETTVQHPVIPVQMFKIPDFTLGLLLSIIRAVALFGLVFLLPIFLQRIQGLSTIQNGIILIPGAISVAVFMPIAGKITDTYGARWPAAVGVLCCSVSLFFYSHIDVDSSYWDIIFPQFFRGAGIALMLTPVITAAMNAVELRLTGIASGLLNVGQQAGGSFGIALLSTVLTRRAVYHAEILGLNPLLSLPGSALTQMAGINAPPETAQAAVLGIIQRAAQVRSFDDVFALAAGICLLGVIPALLLSARPAPRKPGSAPAAE